MIEIITSREKYRHYKEMIVWCTEQFGPGWNMDSPAYQIANLPWGEDGLFGCTFWTFRDNKHATLFSLRWA
jgi:hypothetical protein